MTNILLSGCNGRMGQVISRLARNSNEKYTIVAGIDIKESCKNEYPVFTKIEDCDIRPDVIIDFSSPDALSEILEYAEIKRIPIVEATTGLSVEQKMMLTDASEKIPVFYSANMSLGICLMLNLVKSAAQVLEKDFDIEIIEKHHNQKLDAPSGTALKIADSINSVLRKECTYEYNRHAKIEKRPETEIGIHSVRGGTIAGEHTVLFAGTEELLEIKHTAVSRDIFGAGALSAAAFLSTKQPGFFDMNSMVESIK